MTEFLTTYGYVLLAGLVLLAPTLVGVLFGSARIQKFLQSRTHTILAFSVGVYSVVAWGLFSEAYEHMPLLHVLGASLGAFLFLEILMRLLSNTHHHHHSDGHDHEHGPVDARAMLISDSVHNVTDGLLLVPAFAVSPILGIATTFSIFAHESVLETAKYFVLRESGYTHAQAIARGFFAGCTVFIGIALALFISGSDTLEPWLLAAATGSIVYVLLRDLLPDVFFHTSEEESYTKTLIALILGVVTLLAVQSMLPHEHESEHAETGEAVHLLE
ncbi:MAG: ZIP family metal transporter [Minisyncoccia bacterium]